MQSTDDLSILAVNLAEQLENDLRIPFDLYNTTKDDADIYQIMNAAGKFLSAQMHFVTIFGRQAELAKQQRAVLSFFAGTLDSFGQAFDLSVTECAAGAPVMVQSALENSVENSQIIAAQVLRFWNSNEKDTRSFLAGGEAVHLFLNSNSLREGRAKTSNRLHDCL